MYLLSLNTLTYNTSRIATRYEIKSKLPLFFVCIRIICTISLTTVTRLYVSFVYCIATIIQVTYRYVR